MRVAKKTAVVATLTGAVMAGTLVGVAPAVASTNGVSSGTTVEGSCGQKFNPSVGGGAAGWTISCGGGKVTVNGWVKDTDADGKAAEVYGAWQNGSNFGTVRAGGKGTVKKFSKTHSGSSVSLYLRVV